MSEFDLKIEYAIAPFWIRFSKLPTHLFMKRALYDIASLICRPLKVDEQTIDRSRPSIAPVCIKIIAKHVNIWDIRWSTAMKSKISLDHGKIRQNGEDSFSLKKNKDNLGTRKNIDVAEPSEVMSDPIAKGLERFEALCHDDDEHEFEDLSDHNVPPNSSADINLKAREVVPDKEKDSQIEKDITIYGHSTSCYDLHGQQSSLAIEDATNTKKRGTVTQNNFTHSRIMTWSRSTIDSFSTIC
ncbi:hypothetical protein Pfo_026765 [Paulownia fortunei]|nr:hypothetical protein Pfo_026765 [Paulownia fortunei]